MSESCAPFEIEATAMERALAQRLYDIHCEVWKNANPAPWRAVSPHRRNELHLYAREVIRQMEWARQLGPREGWAQDLKIADCPLTLAPEDWAP